MSLLKNSITPKVKELSNNYLYLISLFLVIFDINLLFHSSEPSGLIFNSLILMPLYGLLLILSGNIAVSFSVFSIIMFLLFYLNEFVYSARKFSIQYCDIYCISDAMRVAANYKFPVNVKIIINAVLVVGVILLAIFMKINYFSKISKKLTRLYGVVIFVASLFISITVFFISSFETPVIDFHMNNFVKLYGLPYSIICEYKSSVVDVPDNYSAENVDRIIEENTIEYSKKINEDVDIIVIMNEAFADFDLVGQNDYNRDPLKNFHAYQKNCIKGKMAVSVFGGKTCNTEFECLTGSSLSFLPLNSIPYLQYMNENVPSIAKDMKKIGYETIAVHPYIAQEWRRTTNYSFLGFDKYISGEMFSSHYTPYNVKDITVAGLNRINFGDDIEHIRGFISDKECYKMILNQLDENNKFIFAVTIQNHGGYYEVDDFESDTISKRGNSEYNQYLTLLSISDTAFKEFTNQLEKRDKKTIVLMFGDHQPGLYDTDTVYENLSGLGEEQYVVPYIMWANYDVEWESYDYISANYLSAVLKKNAGIELNAWDNIRLKSMERYPALTWYYCVSDEGNILPIDYSLNNDMVSDYMQVQYNYIFDNDLK